MMALETLFRNVILQAQLEQKEQELAMAAKDAAKDRAGADLRLQAQVAQKEREIALAAKELEKEKADHRASRLLHSLQDANYQLLRLHNLLDMRGILEFVEQSYKEEPGTRPAPQVMWEGVLNDRKSLVACISQKTGWPLNTTKIASRICSLKDTLKHSHLAYTPAERASRRAIIITNEHHASLLDCHVLACISEEFVIPYEVQLSAQDEAPLE
ncbi:hypothetical protein JKP88DRAFT_223123 [Tribonema minus]|uniref:Uncharacterized protein n=1 Tax=Tribonema minus TaxID=303371 RepID=A0A835Z0F4_9STRA|nr:hypothetical protein JKP88DRAFT_223123 [Tribonema minus]